MNRNDKLIVALLFTALMAWLFYTNKQREKALEELLIAEGSDWCWWYGPEHDSANRPEFDELYRNHLTNVYRFLNLSPPEELSRPILRISIPEVRIAPSGPIRPDIDGQVTSYFEWLGAGVCHVDERSGSMHGKKFVVREVQFGSDGSNLFLRVDFDANYQDEISGMEARFTLEALQLARVTRLTIALNAGSAQAVETLDPSMECALGRVLEARIPLAALGVAAGAGLRFQFSLWQGGLPIDAVPQQGWIEMRTTDPVEMTT